MGYYKSISASSIWEHITKTITSDTVSVNASSSTYIDIYPEKNEIIFLCIELNSSSSNSYFEVLVRDQTNAEWRRILKKYGNGTDFLSENLILLLDENYYIHIYVYNAETNARDFNCVIGRVALE